MSLSITKHPESFTINSEPNPRECSNMYNLITSFEYSQQCRAFGFNASDNIWVLGYGFEILVCQKENETLRVDQILQGHTSLTKKICFSTGSWNDNVIVWTRDLDGIWNKQYLIYKEGQTREFEVVQLILNENEDELIGVMDYNFIIVWKKTPEKWINSQIIPISQNELAQIHQVSYDIQFYKIIIITQNGQVQILAKNQLDLWKKRQSINLKAIKGKKQYNIDNDSLVIQGLKGEQLLFNFNRENELYEESQREVSQTLNQIFEMNTQMSQSQEICALRKTNFCRYQKGYKNLYQQIQTIQFEQNFFYQFSKNGQYLITWDYSKQIQIWKYKSD